MFDDSKVTKVIDLIPGIVRNLQVVDVSKISADTFWNEFVCRHRPVVIKNAVGHWPAVQEWHKVGYLESISDSTQISVAHSFNVLPVIEGFTRSMSRMSLHDCIVNMRQASLDNTLSVPALPVPNSWSKDLGNYAFLTAKNDKLPRVYSQRRLFFYKNASSEWHYHMTDETLTTQLCGSKRVSLFRLNSANWRQYSAVIFSNLHHTAGGKFLFPKDDSLIKYEAVLEPGDVLYIPPFWWHGIDPADSNLGVTLAHCFRTPWLRLGDWQEPSITAAFPDKSWKLSGYPKSKLVTYVTLSSFLRRIRGERWRLDSDEPLDNAPKN